MIDDVEIPTHDGPHAPGPRGSSGNGRGGARGPRVPWRWRRRLRHPGKPRVKKLRLLLILSGLGILAVISTVFGMMMAVASDLPELENKAVYRHAANSFLYDDHWRPIGIFAPTWPPSTTRWPASTTCSRPRPGWPSWSSASGDRSVSA